jgi:restriction system protein
MTFLEAAYQILRQAKKPLHYTEIASHALAAGSLDTKGQTPEATMGSRLYTDTKKKGTRFRRVSRGVFGLAESQPTDIAQRITTLNQKTRDELRDRLMNMPPERFEVLVGQLLTALGFEEDTINVTSYSSDGGVDVRGVLNAAGITKINAAVQAKRWKNNIQAPAIQALRGSLTVHEQGIFITTSGFSKGAIAEAKATGKTPISPIDGDRLITLLIEHEIGVINEQHVLHTLDEDWWGDVASGVEATPPAKESPRPTIDYPLPIRARTKKVQYEAELLGPDGRVLFNGAVYQSPSGAGKAATGWPSCSGWTFWQYQNPETGKWRVIDDLRAK